MPPYNRLAIASLVLGGLGFSFLPLIGSVGAIVTGAMARRRIEGEPDQWRGLEMARWGFSLGIGALVLAVLLGLLLLYVRFVMEGSPEG